MKATAAKDALSAYRYKIELHSHTNPASGCAVFRADEVIRRYAKIGYDGIVITNHLTPYTPHGDESLDRAAERWLADYRLAEKVGKERGVKVYFGAELNFSDKKNDYLLIGIDENEIPKLLSLVRGDLENFRRNYRNDNSILIWAHPCREGMKDIDLSLVDGFEVFNMHPNHKSNVGFAANRFSGLGKPITCGTDFHDPNAEGMCAMLFNRLPENSADIASIIKSRDYLLQIGESVIIP